MKITKHLKFADFSYDEVEKTFTVADKEGNKIELNKVYSFAFMRFVIRIAQRNWLRTKKIIDTESPTVIELDLQQVENQDQLVFEDYQEPIFTETVSEDA